jgi:3'-phosphoadenosine 5'-phosphosulfate sulfotransferase (PAPS reductase)/FAD synthetase
MNDHPPLEIWRLRQMQAISPEAKVQRTTRKILEFVSQVGGLAYVSWSGGLDSRVLLGIVRNECGLSEDRVPAVFVDTGLEYPDVRECALRHASVVLKPKMNYAQVVKKYGYPVISKKTAQYVAEVQSALRKGNPESATVRLRMTGFTTAGKFSKLGKLANKWRFLCKAPFRISNHCCAVLKKRPMQKYQSESKRFPMIGIMAGDGMQRERTFLGKRGGSCNVFGDNASAWPLAIWTNEDIWWYVRSRKLDYARQYDQGATSTGCYACMFGIHMEKGENRFQRMYRNDPKLWKACMDGFGCRQIMEYIGLPILPDVELNLTERKTDEC